MRLRHILVLLIFCVYTWLGSSRGRVLNKDNENLVTKLESLVTKQRTSKNVRGHWDRTRDAHNESTSVDEKEAILFRYVLVNLLHTLQRSIRVVSGLIRVCGDTFAGVLSGVVKATGGLLGLTANVLSYVSSKLDLNQPLLAPYVGNMSTNCASGLRHSAVLLRGLGEACIWSGEILETMTLGLGEAVQDSFWGLEMVSNSSNVLVQFLLQIENASVVSGLGGTSSVQPRHSNSVWNSIPVSHSNYTAALFSNNNSVNNGNNQSVAIAHRKAIDHHKGDILHKKHAEPPLPNELHETSDIEVRLGKEWIAPAAGSVYGSSASAGEDTADDVNADDLPPQSNNHHNHHNHHNYNHRQGELSVGDTLHVLYTYMYTCYIFCVQHLPYLVPQYIQSMYISGQAYMHVATTVVIQLGTTILAAHAMHSDVPSQGLFFLLAMVAVCILSITPYNIRTKLCTVMAFCTLVYVSFVTTESIQRRRLVQQTTVKAAHDLLRQQAQQRSRRADSGAPGYAGGTSGVYDTYDTYSAYSVYDVHSGTGGSGDGYVDMEELQQHSTDNTVPASPYSAAFTANTADRVPDMGASSESHPTNPATPTNTRTTAPTHSPEQAPPPPQHITHDEILHYDDAIWLNTALTALWEVLDPAYSTGGLGPYISDMYADMVSTELGKVPPGVANVRLKSFALGSSAPLFKGVRVIRARNHTCLQESLYSELYHTQPSTSTVGGSGADATYTTHKHAGTQDARRDRSDKDDGFNISDHENFLTKLWHFIDKRGGGMFIHTTHTTHSGDSHDSHGEASQLHNDVGAATDGAGASTSTAANQPTTSTHSSDKPHKPHKQHKQSHKGKNHPHDAQHPQYTAMQHKFLSQFSSQCDRLILEMDTVYASTDMNVVLSLRSSDLKSVVPEVSVTLSELHLAGQLRLNVSLTADYPFLGDGHLSFLSAPQLDFSISSFGGLELSSVPYAYYWVNTSMHWLLEQYTAPHYTTLDLRHTVCPRCDLPLIPVHTTLYEVLLESWLHAQAGVKNSVEQAVFTAQQTRRFMIRLGKELHKLSIKGKELSKKAAVGFARVRQHTKSLMQKAAYHIQQAERSRHKSLPMPDQPTTSAYLTDTFRNREARKAREAKRVKQEEQSELHYAWYKGFDFVDEDMLATDSVGPSTGSINGGVGVGKPQVVPSSTVKAGSAALKRLQQWAGGIRQAVVLA